MINDAINLKIIHIKLLETNEKSILKTEQIIT